MSKKILSNITLCALGLACVGVVGYSSRNEQVNNDLQIEASGAILNLHDLRQSLEVGVKYGSNEHLSVLQRKRVNLQNQYNSSLISAAEHKDEEVANAISQVVQYVSLVNENANEILQINKAKVSAEHLLETVNMDLDSLQQMLRQAEGEVLPAESAAEFIRRNQTVKNEVNRIVKNLDKVQQRAAFSRNLSNYVVMNFGAGLPNNSSFQVRARSLSKGLTELNNVLKPVFASTTDFSIIEKIEKDLEANLKLIEQTIAKIKSMAEEKKQLNEGGNILLFVLLFLLWISAFYFLNRRSSNTVSTQTQVSNEKHRHVYQKVKLLEQSTARLVKLNGDGTGVVESGIIDPTTYRETKIEKIVGRFNYVLGNLNSLRDRVSSIEQIAINNIPVVLSKMAVLSKQNEGSFLTIENEQLTESIKKTEELVEKQDRGLDTIANAVVNLGLNSTNLVEDLGKVKVGFNNTRQKMNDTAKQIKRSGEETQKMQENLDELKELSGKVSVIGMNLAIEFSGVDDRFAKYSNELQTIIELIEMNLSKLKINLSSVQDVSIGSAKILEDLNNNVVQEDSRIDDITETLKRMKEYIESSEKNNNNNITLISELKTTINVLKSYQEVSKLKDVAKNEVLLTVDALLKRSLEIVNRR